ncbi:hypothetical protein [Flavobacterium sp.]|uniref:hypothetical protein n=1 Tax=Flavobacterium sp. TaxID=239 RepID=UPI00391A716A
MKRYFLIIFCLYVGFNTVYNTYRYFQSDKVLAKVIGFERYKKTRETRTKTTIEISDSPVVVYTYKNYDWEASDQKWGHINLLDIGDEVTVLINEKNDWIGLNTFFQFWFTLNDIFISFSLCCVGTIVLESVFPTKEKAPKTWK